LRAKRLSEPFERLREASEAHRASTGARPKVLLVNLGSLAEHNTRSSWTKNVLAAGGIQAIVSEPLGDAAGVGRAFDAADSTVAIICSSDRVYEDMAEAAAQTLRSAGCTRLLLAGRPADGGDALRAAGVHDFIHVGRNILELLEELHRDLGVQS
jgi:methylmalonyl-CoA mutase